MPITASTLANTADKHIGENVTLYAAVEQTLSKTTFTVDQDKTKTTGKDVLVIMPKVYGSVEASTYVTVIGEVVKFDPSELAAKVKDYTLDMPADAAAKLKGRPAIIATSVINAAMIDITKRLPPPMTADEEALSKIMKQVAPALAALRKGIEGSDAKVAKEQSDVLRKTFAETETFWKTRGKMDATKWATDGRRAIEVIDVSAAAGKWDDVKTQATALGQTCTSCHGVYRDRFDDGSFRIKK